MIDPISYLSEVSGVPRTVVAKLRTAVPLFTSQQVEYAVDQAAIQLTVKLQDKNPILISVLHGGLVYTGMLMRRLSFPLQQGYVQIKQYGDKTTPGELSWQAHDMPNLSGRTVLIVDDIHDRGVTMQALLAWCKDQDAADVVTTVLVEKQLKITKPQHIDVPALVCEDKFLVGCGLDFAGYGRNLPAIYALADD